MAFRPRRQTNYTYLRQHGFLPFEAQALSKVPRKVPYMPSLVRSRSAVYNKAKKEGWSQARYNRHITDTYKRKGWTRLTRTGKEVLSPWEMLHNIEDRYRDKHPEYTSPWLTKAKQWRDFQQKYESGQDKYPMGKTYKSKTQELKGKGKL